jgi:hypothetical protein
MDVRIPREIGVITLVATAAKKSASAKGEKP